MHNLLLSIPHNVQAIYSVTGPQVLGAPARPRGTRCERRRVPRCPISAALRHAAGGCDLVLQPSCAGPSTAQSKHGSGSRSNLRRFRSSQYIATECAGLRNQLSSDIVGGVRRLGRRTPSPKLGRRSVRFVALRVIVRARLGDSWDGEERHEHLGRALYAG